MTKSNKLIIGPLKTEEFAIFENNSYFSIQAEVTNEEINFHGPKKPLTLVGWEDDQI